MGCDKSLPGGCSEGKLSYFSALFFPSLILFGHFSVNESGLCASLIPSALLKFMFQWVKALVDISLLE